MYRSVLLLNLQHPSARAALLNAHDMHRNLMKAFSGEEGSALRKDHEVLYAMLPSGRETVLYVTSADRPDWAAVKGVSLYEGREPLCIDGLREKFTPGTRLSFRLFASPCKRAPREGKLGHKVYLRLPEERLAWLERQAAKSGFALLGVTEEKQETVHAVRKGADVYYTGALFTGVLEVTDTDAFWQAYCSGIGPGRPYGLGMLMVKRA